MGMTNSVNYITKIFHHIDAKFCKSNIARKQYKLCKNSRSHDKYLIISPSPTRQFEYSVVVEHFEMQTVEKV